MIHIIWAVALCVTGLLFWLAFAWWNNSPAGHESIDEMIYEEELNALVKRHDT